jgi:phosphate:Na+ symporter
MMILAKDVVIKAFEPMNETAFDEIKKMEDKTDLYEDTLNSYLINLSNKNLTSQDNRKVTSMLHNSGDIERIADYGINIARTIMEKNSKDVSFSDSGNKEIEEIKNTVFSTLDTTIDILKNKNTAGINTLTVLENEIKSQKSNSRTNHVQRLKNKECSNSSGIYFLDLLTFMERISAICVNIGNNTNLE